MHPLNKPNKSLNDPDKSAIDSGKPRDYSHLIPPATRLLRFTAKYTWKMMKGLVTVAFRIPHLFAKINKKNTQKGAPKRTQKSSNPLKAV